MPAMPVHHTAVDKTGSWDAGENLKRLGDSPTESALRDMHAWVDPKGTADAKSSYKLPHHDVSTDGKVGSANMSGVESAMGRLNGGGLEVPESDRAGIHAHLAAHYKDADMKAPDLQSAAPPADESENPEEPEEPETPAPKMAAGFQAVERLDMAMDAGTANDIDRTIDCVWYTGQAVDRQNWMTGDQYTLTLGMEPDQCDLARLNSGAPILDSHNTTAGGGLFAPDTVRSQLGVVVPGSARIDGGKGKAKLRFSKLPEVTPIWQNVKDKIITKLSVGTNIITRKDISPDPEQKKKNFLATKHQPFEISLASIPADYGTAFLSGDGNRPPRLRLPSGTEIFIDASPSSTTRATAQPKEQPVETQQQVDAGAEARKVELAAASKKAADDAVKAERERCNAIKLMAAPFKIDQAFLAGLIDNGSSVEDARKSIFEELGKQAAKDANGKPFPIDSTNGGATITRDQRDTLRAQMEASVFLRGNPNASAEIRELGRDFAGLTLLELARECLNVAGVKTRGMSRSEVARVALQGRYGAQEYFGGMETTSDLPNILANVANKTLRMAYEAAPRTFQVFATMVSAADFKPVNRVQLSDIATLHAINEKGEYHRTYLSDSKETYSLVTYGDIVPITRKVIINDDLQALTRVPGSLGTAAARLEGDTVWAVITANANMSDGIALFHASHANLSGSNALAAVANVTTARAQLRKQTGPKGTILNLIPRYLIVPAALEGIASQLTNPINIASTVASNVVPEFIRTMIPVVEPRLDAVVSVGATNWYTAADPSQITSLEYCYLEGQQGVYTETRQGFDTDGVEIKARLDFAAAAIDYRGLQKNTSA